jgi:chromosomal replication initiation ATPase DnaA
MVPELSFHDNDLSKYLPPSAGNTYSQTADLIAAMDRACARVAAMPLGASPAAVQLVRRTLTALRRGPFAELTDRIAAEFHLHPDQLRSKSREQRIAFARQVAYFFARKLTGASLPEIARHFHKHHASVVYGAQLIEQRMERDVGFHRSMVELECRMAGTVATTAAAA